MTTDPSHSDTTREPELHYPSKLHKKAPPWHYRVLMWGGGIILIGLGTSLISGWFFLQRNLTPWVETELSDFLNRPVNLGNLQYFSLSRVRFGESKIAQTTTDPAQVTMTALDVAYNPLTLLLKRELEIKVTAIQPNVYLKQGEQGNWLLTKLDDFTGNNFIKLKFLQIKDANLILAPYSAKGTVSATTKFKHLSSQINIIDNLGIITFKINSHLTAGGKFEVIGSKKWSTKEINLLVRGHRLDVKNFKKIEHFIDVPLAFEQGKIDANLEVNLKPNQLPELRGVVNLHQVNTSIVSLLHPVQTQGKLRLKGTKIRFDKVATRFGSITGITKGELDLKTGYNLDTITKPTSISQIFTTFKKQSPAIALGGDFQGVLRIRGKLNNPQIHSTVSNTKLSKIDKIEFKKIYAQFFADKSTLLIKQIQAVPIFGGAITGKGKIDIVTTNSDKFGKFVFDLQSSNLAGETLSRIYQTEYPIKIDKLSSKLIISGIVHKPETLRVQGNSHLKIGNGAIKADNLNYYQGDWQGTIETLNIDLDSLVLPVPKELNNGILQGIFKISGNVNKPFLETLKVTGKAQVFMKDGKIIADDLRIYKGKWNIGSVFINVKTKNIYLKNIPSLDGILKATFNLAGNLPLGLDQIQGGGNATLELSQGKINANEFKLNDGKWSSKLLINDLYINQIFSEATDKVPDKLKLLFNLPGTLSVASENLLGKVNAELLLPKGHTDIQKIELYDSKFISTISTEVVNLNQFNSDLNNKVNGKIEVNGRLDSITPQNVEVRGKLNFSQGLGVIKSPFQTVFSWKDDTLTIDQATATGMSIKGWSKINWLVLGKTQDVLKIIKEFYVDISAKRLDFKNLLPILSKVNSTFNNNKINPTGKVNFVGAIMGTPDAPNINGQLSLINFNLGSLRFDPVLEGKLNVNPKRGVELALDGKKDHLHLELDNQSKPLAISLKQEQVQLEGTREGRKVNLEVRQIPISLLQNYILKRGGTKKFSSTLSLFDASTYLLTQPLLGEISGQFILNLNTGAIAGREVVIFNPQLGTVKGQKLTGDVQYVDRNLTIKKGKLTLNNSLYSFEGNFTPTSQGPHLNANVTVDQGNIQNILETLQIFELKDIRRGLTTPQYAKAKDLYKTKRISNTDQETVLDKLERTKSLLPTFTLKPPLAEVGSDKATISDRLIHFLAINDWLSRQKQTRKKASPLPELQQLQGVFDGKIAVKFTPKSGLEANFDFSGQNWNWGDFNLTHINSKGSWQKGILTLNSVGLQHKSSQIAFAGHIGKKNQEGKLRLVNIPLDEFSEFLSLPEILDIGGQLNANVSLAGNRDNPEILGKLAINKASINKTTLQSTEGRFTYHRGRMNFSASSILGKRTQPLTVKGTFPYQLPFTKVQPNSDRLSLTVDVQNEGLTILNLLTKGQVAWLGGQGKIKLNVSGLLDQKLGLPTQLNANGIAQIENATIEAKVVPDAPLTNVNGKILFDLDRLTVAGLTGKFSGGQVTIEGSLPILKTIKQQHPLTIDFNNLVLDLPQRYQGGVKGTIQVGGTVLRPKIGGDLELFEGEVLLGDTREERQKMPTYLEFAGLKLTLVENISISRLPLLSFLATGSLAVDGNIDQPRLEGIITLQNGLVNLFASQLRLAESQKNTAEFLPNHGLDPYLNIKLFTSTTETTRNRVNVNPISSEINDPFSANTDSLQTVRIQATVKGFASQLNNGIELTSQPKRNSAEIIALLGGSFLSPLEKLETQLGLAHLAGTAVFGPVQGAIGKALGLSEFRVFPTQLIDETEQLNNPYIGVVAEAGINITDELSVSMQKILNNDSPSHMGIRYHINDNILIRGSSNFTDDSRGSIQFEQRF
ncbi:translocation/assembly module TamB domain-containing protein [Cyanobacterium sp. uoEpiScrs1]|uniref:translocation/assembly module TamB domain-containing protein n=1 Tax=Cyanobacterium sp. uoEpiScrs1 TaxID=2976343 RepID=UPI00226A5AD7|nr:translocation/assembly module TamB domain-containing protein [Cyanobacterium sp. uoEpiScrs1]